MTGVVLALDAVLLGMCWLVMLIAAGALQPVDRAARWRLGAGGIASAVTLLSGSFMIALAAREGTGVASLDLPTLQQLSLPVDAQTVPFLLLLTGLAGPWLLLVGRPSWPLNRVRAEVLAVMRLGVIVFLPIYGLLRLNLPMLPQASRVFIPLLAGDRRGRALRRRGPGLTGQGLGRGAVLRRPGAGRCYPAGSGGDRPDSFNLLTGSFYSRAFFETECLALVWR